MIKRGAAAAVSILALVLCACSSPPPQQPGAQRVERRHRHLLGRGTSARGTGALHRWVVEVLRGARFITGAVLPIGLACDESLFGDEDIPTAVTASLAELLQRLAAAKLDAAAT